MSKEQPMERDRVQAAQDTLAQIAGEILSIEDRLSRVLWGLPESPKRDAMEEGEIPCDVATDLRGALECVLADSLRPAIRTLEQAASATDTRLKGEWCERQKRRRL